MDGRLVGSRERSEVSKVVPVVVRKGNFERRTAPVLDNTAALVVTLTRPEGTERINVLLGVGTGQA